MTRTLFQLGIKDRRMLAAARRAAGGEGALLGRVRADARRSGTAVAVLSTCERMEVYALGDAREAGHLAGALSEHFDQSEPSVLEHRIGGAAAAHLFTVAAGLDSRLIGEPHILGQVSKAVIEQNADAESGLVLARLLQSAVASGRRARTSTGLGQLAVSCVDAVIGRLRDQVGVQVDKCVAVLGSGSLAREIAHRLTSEGWAGVSVLARHCDAASQTLGGTRVRVGPLHELAEQMHGLDVVIAATASPEFLVTRETVGERGTPLVLIDLGVPSNIDPALRHVCGVRLITLDDVSADQQRPHDVMAEASELVQSAAERWSRRWLMDAVCVPPEKRHRSGVA